MKKYLTLIIAAMLMAGCLAACSSGQKSETPANASLSIVTTIFPEYDWVRNILGENPAGAEVTMLLDSGVDLHSFQPTAEDIMKISACDLFIYVGGESDNWVEDALQEAVNEDMIVINLLDALGDRVKEEELVEGMEPEEEDEESNEERDEASEEDIEYDEHVWLSLTNAAYLVDVLSDALQSLDADHSSIYQSNAKSYIEKLESLDHEYHTIVTESPITTLLFGDRFPFRYLTDDYGLSYYAAFAGCSAETEASFATITFLAQKVDELSLHAVMTIEGTDHKIAETIVQDVLQAGMKEADSDSTLAEIITETAEADDIKAETDAVSTITEDLYPETTARLVKESAASQTESSVTAESRVLSTTEGIDIDLTILPGSLVYAEVYNMMYEPEEYIGKTIRMNGAFRVYHDYDLDEHYFYCIISDAAACCQQGMEFVLAGDHAYPEDYPEEGGEITVTGVFDTYTEGGYMYCNLRDAALL